MSTERLAFRCKGCGELDTIVEVSLLPRSFGVTPDEDGDYSLDEGHDELYLEGDQVVGYGCTTDDCEYWQGDLGTTGRLEDGNLSIRTGPIKPQYIAEIVKVTESYTTETQVEVVG